MRTLTPIKKKVLIKSDGKDTTRESGIITNISNTGSLRKGTVVAVGSLVQDLKEGDRIWFQVFEPNPVRFEGEEYELLYETEVIGFINE